jgi:hypothetical protein
MLTMDTELRRRWSQLPAPLPRPWAERPVLVLDRGTPWVYGPVESDPTMTEGGALVLPRGVIRRLTELAALELPFQRLAIAHELDPDGPAARYLPDLRSGPRPCTPAEARALVGPPPAHPALRRAARVLDALVGGTARAVAAPLLDPIIFGVVGSPDLVPGKIARYYPLAAWRW